MKKLEEVKIIQISAAASTVHRVYGIGSDGLIYEWFYPQLFSKKETGWYLFDGNNP